MRYVAGPTNKILLAALCTALLQLGCEKGADSFSTLAASENFNQAAAVVNNKIDILWVVDNSGSMAPLQANLVANFNSFIANFQAKGFDFQIGVTTTDAYLAGANFQNNSSKSLLRDGVTTHSGYRIINNSTPDISGAFVINATQGINGAGDERAFGSLVETLNNPANSSFHRPGAYLAVVILSDEDDFSDKIGSTLAAARAQNSADHNYNNTNLMTSAELISFLDNVTGSTPTSRSYNVSAITVIDNACRVSHYNSAVAAQSTLIGTRYMDLVQKTNGILGSVCDASYASSLNFIQQRITELATQFKLDRLPLVDSIKILSNEISVPQDSQNGWTYDSGANAIIFHGSAVPSASAVIKVSYDPAGVKN